MHRRYCIPFIILAQALPSLAEIVTYTWDVTWVNASPDGFARPIIGINGRWPCPLIEANIGDTIVVHMTNLLGNETSGIHFHGINQIDSPEMDGASGVVQCPCPPNNTVTYSFLADEPGTFWWHSHNLGQYPDGLRGPIVIHDPNDPYIDECDQDILITVSDWYHSQTPQLVSAMIIPNNTQFTPPRPDSIIVNEGGDGHIPVEAGKTYRFRVINFSALTSTFLKIKSHDMSVIMTDASYVKKQATSVLRISPAERYDFLVTIDKERESNIPFLFALDSNPDYTAGNASFHFNFTGQLVVDPEGDLTQTVPVDEFDPLDETKLESYDGRESYGPVTKQWVLDFDFCLDNNGYPRSCFNSTTYIPQRVPTLYSAVSLGPNNVNAAAYGQVNPFIVEYGDVVEIVVNNHDIAIHPFHLHGHKFQVMERPASNTGNWSGTTDESNSSPPRKDTISIRPQSYAVLRIVANNPGVWLFHCHIEWHVEMGLTATLIEAPDRLADFEIPPDHLDLCRAMGIPTVGNAAGNTAWDDNTGFLTLPPTDYIGAVWPAPGPISGSGVNTEKHIVSNGYRRTHLLVLQ
ncbi:putative iron transport multicopper oxidase fet3 protein [Eutypa lata UCREL1]|uniref:Putative iron transport multicopper oxidase fet3 protein n=1 Tax=Eutypa lata (strain UCR-EL1) TaxID=1287681 RepID=M7SJX7_EUTLA|nr:putative iron transport multicopper oxidase fet3 protein [Eutypa lata UCREL1]